MKRLLLSIALLLCVHVLLAQVKVTFVIAQLPARTPEPMLFYLAGDFNAWQPANAKWQLQTAADGSYQLTQTLAPGSHEFKLTRGGWDKAECSASGAPIDNRAAHITHDTTIVLKIADWQDLHPIPTVNKKHTASANVHIISESFDMPQLGKKRRVWIYLPKDYQTSHKKYPVIYMHDGQNLFDEYTGNYGEWGVDEFLDSLKSNAKQFIVVGIDNGLADRMAEYSPYNSDYAKGTGDKYVAFLVETLKPYIDSHYRTVTDAQHTNITGSSMGGLISIYAAVKYPKVFGSAGVFSPAFWVNKPIYDYVKSNIPKNGRFYFVCGDKESDTEVADMDRMVNITRQAGLPEKDTPRVVISGAKHNEAQWRGDFPAFYRWLVSGMK